MQTNELSKVVKCEDCIFAKSSKDPFTGRVNYKCGKDYEIEVGGFGDFCLMQNSGCEDGQRRARR